VVSEENPERYSEGGYHPISIGERFNDKYQVISKLGYGLYSTVWLAKDLT
jgi:serine/threonine-protein kinase SRPK3